jgi:hypothetical protein
MQPKKNKRENYDSGYFQIAVSLSSPWTSLASNIPGTQNRSKSTLDSLSPTRIPIRHAKVGVMT